MKHSKSGFIATAVLLMFTIHANATSRCGRRLGGQSILHCRNVADGAEFSVWFGRRSFSIDLDGQTKEFQNQSPVDPGAATRVYLIWGDPSLVAEVDAGLVSSSGPGQIKIFENGRPRLELRCEILGLRG